MLDIHQNDLRIRMTADTWKATGEDKESTADAANSAVYATARATDDAVAHMADHVVSAGAGFVRTR